MFVEKKFPFCDFISVLFGSFFFGVLGKTCFFLSFIFLSMLSDILLIPTEVSFDIFVTRRKWKFKKKYIVTIRNNCMKREEKEEKLHTFSFC